MSNEDLIREMANLNITPRLRQDDQDEDNGNIHHQDEHENFEEEPDNNQMLAARIELLSQTLASTLNQRKTVRFDEVEKTFRRFSGNSHENFNNWLTHFEEQCLLYELNSRSTLSMKAKRRIIWNSSKNFRKNLVKPLIAR